MAGALANFTVRRFEVPIERRVGDHSLCSENLSMGSLQLIDEDGLEGLGFFVSLAGRLPDAQSCRLHFTDVAWSGMQHSSPEGLVQQVAPPRRGHKPSLSFNMDNALDQALWDLVAKRADQPLYQLLGGASDRVPAYASGLCFPLNDDELHDFYATAAATGYRFFKVKVGHTDPARDLSRLRIVRNAVGETAELMIDANEAWTVQETLDRIDRFQGAGIALRWIEDPLMRDDFHGLALLRSRVSGVQINAGEYLDSGGRAGLIWSGAADIININDLIGEGIRVAWLAALRGLPVTLGNSVLNIGAHLAAALPNVQLTEDSLLPWTKLVADPILAVDGEFRLSSRHGHGLTLAEGAAQCFEIL